MFWSIKSPFSGSHEVCPSIGKEYYMRSSAVNEDFDAHDCGFCREIGGYFEMDGASVQASEEADPFLFLSSAETYVEWPGVGRWASVRFQSLFGQWSHNWASRKRTAEETAALAMSLDAPQELVDTLDPVFPLNGSIIIIIKGI